MSATIIAAELRGLTDFDVAILPFALLAASLVCTACLAWAHGRRSVLARLNDLAVQARAAERYARVQLDQLTEAGGSFVALVDDMDEARHRHEILAEAHRRLAR